MTEDNIQVTGAGTDEGGKIVFAPEVIATIANLATTEIDGVASMGGTVVEGLSGILGGKKNLTKGIKVELAEDSTSVEMVIVVKYGYKIKDVCTKIQQSVKNAIETMTGLNVTAVNVAVQSIVFEKEPKQEKLPEQE